MEEDEKVISLPSTTIEDVDPDLEYTQNLRKKVIDRILQDNKGDVPIDKEGAGVLAIFLDGIDRQSVAKQRIKIAKKDSQSTAQIAKVLEEISRKRNSGEHIEIDITPSPNALPRAVAMSGDFLPAPKIVSGELDMENQQETPDEFFKRVENAHPELLTGGAADD